MRALVVFPYDCHDSGGVRNAAMGLIRTLRRIGVTVDVATPSARPVQRDEQMESIVDRIHYYPNLPASKKGVFSGRGVVAQNVVSEVGLVIVWWLTGFCKRFADEALRQKKPYYFYSGGIFSDFGITNRLLKLVYFTVVSGFIRKSAGVVLPTSREVDQFRVLNPFCRRKGVYIPHEIPRVDYLPNKKGNDRFTFGFMGRLHVPVKGLDLLIRAFARAKCRKDARILLAGPDWEDGKKQLANIMREVGITKTEAEFIGPVYGRAKAEYLSSLDCYVQLSRYEGFGIAIVEAMQYGTPVLISNRANILMDLKNARACIDTELSVGRIAEKLDFMYAKKGKMLDELGERGRRWVTDNCSIEVVAEKTKHFFSEQGLQFQGDVDKTQGWE